MRYAIIILVAVLFIAGCSGSAVEEEPVVNVSVDNTFIEITENDIFSMENITSMNISVMGVALGDKAIDMISALGEPDIIIPYQNESIFNCEYMLGLNDTGLLFHVENDIITRISIFEAFDEYLVDETKIAGKDKYDIYGMLGTPESQIEEPGVRVFLYENGIDILLDRKYLMGYSLRLLGNKKGLLTEIFDTF